ncbi:MAG: hypothetical protein PWP58_1523 [Bacillota bacterium]|nr:hypothetical protein [Bacillota bacterium]
MNADTLAAVRLTLIALPTMFVVIALFIAACNLLVRFFPEASCASSKDNESMNDTQSRHFAA